MLAETLPIYTLVEIPASFLRTWLTDTTHNSLLSSSLSLARALSLPGAHKFLGRVSKGDGSRPYLKIG